MKIKVIKRDGRIKGFDETRIRNAISKAYEEVHGNVDINKISLIEDSIIKDIGDKTIELNKDEIHIETIQDIVIKNLKKTDKSVGEAYEKYRNKRTLERDKKSSLMNTIHKIGVETDRDNANVGNNFSAKLLRIASESNKWHNLATMPEYLSKQHLNGDLYYHDLDSYNLTVNCLHIPTKEVLEKGFNTGYGTINKPKRIESAAELSCILLQSTQNDMFGGQAHPNFDNDMAVFVDPTRQEIKKELEEYGIQGEQLEQLSEDKLKKTIHQAMQSIIYNLNTMHARAGSQVPFSSVNIGIPNSKDAALICKIFLEEYDKGLGKGEQPVFPNIIFRVKEGVNRNSNDLYYYLYKLACDVASKRMNPTFMNIDADFNKKYYDQGVMPATMGCVDGKEVITYKIHNELFVESFERMWDRLSKIFEIKEQDVKDNYYMDLKNIKIYDTQKGFVNVKRIIKNKDKGDWIKIKFSNGRCLTATQDHPLPIIDKGRTLVKDVQIGDRIIINQNQYSEEINKEDIDKAWLLGFILCDGCYDNHIFSSIDFDTENDIEERYKKVFKKIYNQEVKTVERHREKKGNYKDLITIGSTKLLQETLINVFGGKQKIHRHIPTEVFSYTREAKLSFLAGMIDADGYIHSIGHRGSTVQLGSINKELSLQTLALAQSLGLPSKVYLNHYNSRNKSKIRYRVEFSATLELIKYLACKKKINCFKKESNITKTDESKIISIEFLGNRNEYSYDVTTESDHFEISGIYSHNCRTYTMSNINGEAGTKGRGNIAPTTINLPRLGILANKDIDKFFSLLDEKLFLARQSLLHRYDILKKLKIKDLPFVAGQGLMKGSEGLDKNDSIEPILKQGTWAIGFIGLAETLIALTGYHHGETKEAKELGIKIITHIREFCDRYKEIDKLNWSTYATPGEGLSGKFIIQDKQKFGIIKGVTDKDYYTNSYHVPVGYSISIEDKIKIEAPYHNLCNGGHISYVEIDDYPTPELIEKIVTFAYSQTNINYIGINFHIRYCKECGTLLHGEDSCPKCNSKNIQGISRVTGYLSLDERFGVGKSAERKDRTSHINGNKFYNVED